MTQNEESQPAVSLRPVTEEDLPQILQIEGRVHLAPWTLDNFRGELAKPYTSFLVLTDDETDAVIYGYIVGQMLFDECQILNVAVDLPHRGLGYAKLMMRKMAGLSVQKGIRRITLEVRKSNLAAVQLYHGLGLSIRQIRKQFYSNGEDAYFMAADLDEGKVTF